MYKFELENENGDRLTFNEIGGAFTIEEIEGLNPPDSTINTSKVALMDGEKFDSAKVQMRTLSVAFAIERDAAANRIEVYRVLKTKEPVIARYKNEHRDVRIEGRVQAVNVTHFAMKQVVTVTIICPSPYWQAAQAVINDLSQVTALFHFPFASTAEPELKMGYIDPLAKAAVVNGGDAATGFVIELYAHRAVTNPKIFDYVTGDYIGLNFEMQPADLITIDTRAGHKTAKLLRNGETTSVFNAVSRGSKWLQLSAFGGMYTYTVETGIASALSVRILHRDIYEGV